MKMECEIKGHVNQPVCNIKMYHACITLKREQHKPVIKHL